MVDTGKPAKKSLLFGCLVAQDSPRNHCPKCRMTFLASVCPLCKDPIGPLAERKTEGLKTGTR